MISDRGRWQIEIAMMAVARSAPYAQRSLEALFGRDDIDCYITGPVRVVVSGDDGGFLGPWLDDERVSVELLAPAVYSEYAGHDVCWRITQTFMRCLEPPARRDSGLVLLQDDVDFAHGWFETVRRTAAEAAYRDSLRSKPQGTVVALFAAGKMRDMPLAPYFPRKFYGNVGLYLSPEVLSPLVDFARERMGDPDDMIVKQFLMDGHAQLYALNPNVVQHTGADSTHGAAFVRSPTFKERFDHKFKKRRGYEVDGVP